MAEGLLNTMFGDSYEASSAGVEPTHVSPYAVEVMREIGIDISDHRSKSIQEFRGKTFDYVVTVCDNAKEVCPFFPGKKILHQSFRDPSDVDGSIDEILNSFREIRDDIKKWVEQTFSKK
jgi:arsenate reductase